MAMTTTMPSTSARTRVRCRAATEPRNARAPPTTRTAPKVPEGATSDARAREVYPREETTDAGDGTTRVTDDDD